jgi:hypothetical protein
MYGRGSLSAVMTGSVATASGVALLPYTAGSSIGTILAYSAITIGLAALASQLVVRVLRKKYQN